MKKIIKNSYHPANISENNPLKHDDRIVITPSKAILYDKDDNPLIRKIGFK